MGEKRKTQKNPTLWMIDGVARFTGSSLCPSPRISPFLLCGDSKVRSSWRFIHVSETKRKAKLFFWIHYSLKKSDFTNGVQSLDFFSTPFLSNPQKTQRLRFKRCTPPTHLTAEKHISTLLTPVPILLKRKPILKLKTDCFVWTPHFYLFFWQW